MNSKKGTYRQAGDTPSRRPAASRRAQPSSRKSAQATRRSAPVQKGQQTRSGSARSGSHAKRSYSSYQRSQAPSRSNARTTTKPTQKVTLWHRFTTSKPAMISAIVIVVIIGIFAFDAAFNAGKAYPGVSINGISMAGMTQNEMQEKLHETFAPRLSQAQVTIYANEEARQKGRSTLEELEAQAIADQQSYEEAITHNEWWSTDALSLKATLPYEDVTAQALALGREDGGPLQRLAMLVSPKDLEMNVTFDAAALDNLASEIDKTVGDERHDASVYVEGSKARAVEGHDGTMVDRDWLADKISDSMIKDSVPDSFVAVATSAPSRITMEQANEMCDMVNKAIDTTASFTYQGKAWTATADEIGNWTVVHTVADGNGGFKLQPTIDEQIAVPVVVKKTGASVSSENTTVKFKKSGDTVQVHSSGTGNIPEVTQAVQDLNEQLYGQSGAIWQGEVVQKHEIEINESEIPDLVSFDEALNLGIITTIGEYTTEFSNYEGTENRNHNIKLAADILNNAIVEADGGFWDFNDESGDTNEEAGFWSAGSIISGEYQDSIGGGICQVATTIFNAVYEACLDVTERHNHSLYIASYPTGRDASVSYPELDFSFKNTLNSDVFMQLSYTDTSLTVKLYSVYTGLSAQSDVGNWEEGAKYKTRFEVDESLGQGASYLKTTGEDGRKIGVTRTIVDDKGKTVKSDYFGSVYDAKDEVYVVGPGTDTAALANKNDNNNSATEV